MSVKIPGQPKPSHEEDLLDEALDESFPASDPASLVEPGGGISGNEDSRHGDQARQKKRGADHGHPKLKDS